MTPAVPLRGEYGALWRDVKIDGTRLPAVIAAVRRMQAGMPSYRSVEKATGVPAAIISVIHERESGGNDAQLPLPR